MSDWHLLIQDDEGAAVAVPLQMKRLTLGRDEENLIRLTQRNVSRQHAIITHEDNKFGFEDLKSSNGSFLNGKKVDGEAPLNNGDTLQIGDYVLQIYQGDLSQLLNEEDDEETLKTQPGINLAGLSELSVEGRSPIAGEVTNTGTLTQNLMHSWGGLGDAPPDSVLIHASLEALQNLLNQAGDSGELNGATIAEPQMTIEKTLVVENALPPIEEATKVEPVATTQERSLLLSSMDSDPDLEQELLPSNQQQGALLGNVPHVPTTTNAIQGVFETVTDENPSSTDKAQLALIESNEDSELELETENELTVTVKEQVTQPAIPEIQALPRLVITNTNLAGKTYPLLDNNITIGRIPQTDFSIIHRSVSRRHARVYREGSQYFVEDLESANGILVDGANESKMQLEGGEIIELGRVQIRFCQAEDDFALAPEDIEAAKEAEKQDYSLSDSSPPAYSSGAVTHISKDQHLFFGLIPKRWVFFWPLASLACVSVWAQRTFSISPKRTHCQPRPVVY